MFEVSVKDLVFENVLKEFIASEAKAHVRNIQKAKAPDLVEKLKELRKELKKARENGEVEYAHELAATIAKKEDELRERTPKESKAIDMLSQKIRELRRQRRDYFRMLVPREVVVGIAQAAVEQPELAGKLIEGAAAVGKGARGA